MYANIIEISIKCKHCGKTYSFPVYDKDLKRFENKEDNIQYIFPYISADYRELLISHICPKCWDKMFGNIDTDD